MNKESKKYLSELIKDIERWTIEARRDELMIIRKKLMRKQKPVDILELANIIKDRIKKLNSELYQRS